MDITQPLKIGALVRVGQVITVAQAKIDDAFSLVPTMFLLVEVNGPRRFKHIAGLGAFEIEQQEAEAFLAAVTDRAWRDAALVIYRAQTSARAVIASRRIVR